MGFFQLPSPLFLSVSSLPVVVAEPLFCSRQQNRTRNVFRATCALGAQIKTTKWSFEMISINLAVSSPKKYRAKAVFATLASLLLALSAFAQGDSSLWGKVTDAANAPVSGATIVIKNLETDRE